MVYYLEHKQKNRPTQEGLMFLKDRPAPTPEPTPPLSLYDEWMAEEEGLDPPEDTPIEDNPRAEENAEYYRSVT